MWHVSYKGHQNRRGSKYCFSTSYPKSCCCVVKSHLKQSLWLTQTEGSWPSSFWSHLLSVTYLTFHAVVKSGFSSSSVHVTSISSKRLKKNPSKINSAKTWAFLPFVFSQTLNLRKASSPWHMFLNGTSLGDTLHFYSRESAGTNGGM